MTARPWLRWMILGLSLALFVVLISEMRIWNAGLRFLFPDDNLVLYPGTDLLGLVSQHLKLVGISSLATLLIGIPLGIWVTRPAGRDILPIVTALTSLGQTFPPVAVLALAVPALGFGLLPTVFALFLYGLLPVVRNTIAGINGVPVGALDAAEGMGMTRYQILIRVELPLAARIIAAGVRISVIINIGTAMIGATIGAGGLGAPVVAGLVQNNLAFVIEGALPAVLLAVLVDQLLSAVERRFAYPGMSV